MQDALVSWNGGSDARRCQIITPENIAGEANHRAISTILLTLIWTLVW